MGTISRLLIWLPLLVLGIILILLGPAVKLFGVVILLAILLLYFYPDEWILICLRANQIDLREPGNEPFLNEKYLKKGGLGYELYWSKYFNDSLVGPFGKKKRFYIIGSSDVSAQTLALIQKVENENKKEVTSTKARVAYTDQLAYLLSFLMIYTRAVEATKRVIVSKSIVEVVQFLLFVYLVAFLRLVSFGRVTLRIRDFNSCHSGVQDFIKIIIQNIKSSYNRFDGVY